MNPLEKDFIISICKTVPAMTCPESVSQWFSEIQKKYNTEVTLKPSLASHLVFIWLSQNRLITLYNMENGSIDL